MPESLAAVISYVDVNCSTTTPSINALLPLVASYDLPLATKPTGDTISARDSTCLKKGVLLRAYLDCLGGCLFRLSVLLGIYHDLTSCIHVF